jgi:hypothetical protein
LYLYILQDEGDSLLKGTSNKSSFLQPNLASLSISPRAVKAAHELAVKHIAWNLYATKSQGLVMHSTRDLTLYIYVEAGFTRMWHKDHVHLRNNVLSCTGFVVLG